METEYQYDGKVVETFSSICELPRGQAMLSNRVVVLLLGATSSGKTSLVNQFFGLELKRTSASSADNKFTIIETLAEADFATLCQRRRGEEKSAERGRVREGDEGDEGEREEGDLLSERELQTPAPNARDARAAEWHQRRANRLFVPLTSIECVHRYGTVLKTLPEQTLRDSEPFAGLLVNGRYVRRNDAREVVVVDSEGLDFQSRDIPRDFPLGLQLLDLFFRLSDRTVFLLRAGGMSDAVASVQVLDLLLGYSSLAPSKQSQYLGRLAPLLKAGASSLVRATVPGGALLSPALDLLLSFAGSVESSPSASHHPNRGQAFSPMGAKISFVISQMDVCVDRADEQSQIFSLGMLLGRHLPKLGKPHGDSLFPISIPAPHRRHITANALQSLLSTIFTPLRNQHKRILREQELRAQLHQCALKLQNDYWLWLVFRCRLFLCRLDSIPDLLARSHARQAYYSSGNGNALTPASSSAQILSSTGTSSSSSIPSWKLMSNL